MGLRWTDSIEVAIALEESHPEVDVVNLRFTDLHKWVRELADFDDAPERSNEKNPRSHPDGLARRARVGGRGAARRAR